MMNAAIYRTFNGPIHIEQVPRPAIMAHGSTGPCNSQQRLLNHEMIIKVMATGVCRSDWHGWKGHDADIRQHGLPFCPGHEFAGIVVELSSSSASAAAAADRHNQNDQRMIQVGDRVVAPFLLSCGVCRYCRDPILRRSTVCVRQQQPGFTYWGSFAEYVAIPVGYAHQHVRVIPANVSFVQAAALGCRFTTAYRAVLQQGKWRDILLQRQPQPQQLLLPPPSMAVFGCGGVGLSCIMIAAAAANTNHSHQRQAAAIIVAVDISQAALDKAAALGATHTVLIDPNKDNNHEHIQQQVMQCLRQTPCSSVTTGSNHQGHKDNDDASVSKEELVVDLDGVDLAIDAAGYASTCENAVYCTRRGGRMVQVGLPINDLDKPDVPMGRVAAREIEIVGSHGFDSQDLDVLLQMIAAGQLDPARLVEKCVTLRQGIQTLQDMDQGGPLGITMITSFQDDETETTTMSKL